MKQHQDGDAPAETSRSAAFGVVVFALALLAGLLCLDSLALLWTRSHLSARAEATMGAWIRGQGVRTWPMDTPESLDLRSSAGLGDVVFEGGSLAFTSTSDDPYVFLRVGPVPVPTWTHERLEIEVEVSKPSDLEVFFWDRGGEEPFQTNRIRLSGHRETLRLHMGDVRLHRARSGSAVRWGRQALWALRVDPVMEKDVAVRLERVSLYPRREAVDSVRAGRKATVLPDRPVSLEQAKLSLAGGEAPSLVTVWIGAYDARDLCEEVVELSRRQGTVFVLHGEGSTLEPEARERVRALADRIAIVTVPCLMGRPEDLLGLARTLGADAGGKPVVPGRNPDLSALEAEPQKTGGGAGKTVLALVLPLLLMGVAGAATARPTRLLEFLALLLFVACGAALMTGYERFSGDWRSVFLAAGLGGAVALGLVRTVRKEGFMVFGLSKEGIAGRGLAGALILTVLAAGLLVGMALLTESFRAKGFQGGRALHYLGKSALQQVALCLFLSASLHRVCGNRRSAAAVLAAFLFSAFHLPNFTVCAGAFLVAVGWAYLYLRWRALLPVIASHAILGSMLALLVSEPLLLSHRMGWAFFR